MGENDEAYFLLVELIDENCRVNSISYKMNPIEITGWLESKKLDIYLQIKGKIKPDFNRTILTDKEPTK